MMTAISAAKDTLLRALEELEAAEETLEGTPDRVDLIVVYSIGKDEGDGGWHEVGGWATTGGPSWMHAAMMRKAASEFDNTGTDPDEEDD